MGAQLPSRHAGRRRAPMADINVTPLVDVMLVLLIIFMVTAPMLTSGVPVQLPDSKAKALEQERKPLQVTVDTKGRIFIDQDEVAERDLPGRLATAAAHGAPSVQLRADTTLDYGRVMRVMGDLNHAGLNRVSLVSSGDRR